MSTQNIAATVQNLRDKFTSGVTRSYEFRIKNLKGLRRFVVDNSQGIKDALKSDLNKCDVESLLCEELLLINEIDMFISNLKSWMAPTYESYPFLMIPAQAGIILCN